MDGDRPRRGRTCTKVPRPRRGRLALPSGARRSDTAARTDRQGVQQADRLRPPPLRRRHERPQGQRVHAGADGEGFRGPRQAHVLRARAAEGAAAVHRPVPRRPRARGLHPLRAVRQKVRAPHDERARGGRPRGDRQHRVPSLGPASRRADRQPQVPLHRPQHAGKEGAEHRGDHRPPARE